MANAFVTFWDWGGPLRSPAVLRLPKRTISTKVDTQPILICRSCLVPVVAREGP